MLVIIIILELVAGTVVPPVAYRGGCIWTRFPVLRFAFCGLYCIPQNAGSGGFAFAFARAFLIAGSYGRFLRGHC